MKRVGRVVGVALCMAAFVGLIVGAVFGGIWLFWDHLFWAVGLGFGIAFLGAGFVLTNGGTKPVFGTGEETKP